MFPPIMHSKRALTWAVFVTEGAIVSFVLDVLGLYVFKQVVSFLR